MAQPTSPPGRQNAPGQQNAPSLPPVATANASPNAAGGPLTLPMISMVDVYSWEGDETVIQLKLDRASSQPVTVSYAVAFESPAPSTHTSASADDFENLNTRPLTGTVTFAPGALEHFVFLDIANDTTWEGNEAFKVVFSNPVGAQLDPNRNHASGFIAENDPAPPPPPLAEPPKVFIEDAMVAEGATLGFNVMLDKGSDTDITMRYDFANGGGAPATNGVDFYDQGADFGGNQGQIVIPAGRTQVVLYMYAHIDGEVESTENFGVNLSNLTGATFGDNFAVGTIVDGTAPPPTYNYDGAFIQPTVSPQVEGDLIGFLIDIGSPRPYEVQLYVEFISATAKPGEDYYIFEHNTYYPKVLANAEGSGINMWMADDNVYDPNESVEAIVYEVMPDNSRARVTSTVFTITDNDAPLV